MENLVAVTVNSFNGSKEKPAKADSNGEMPVILEVLAGTYPNRTVLSGTVAKNAGFEVGKAYLAKVRETEEDPQYGRQFVWTKANELSAMEIVDLSSKLGQPKMFDVAKRTTSSAPKAGITANAGFEQEK